MIKRLLVSISIVAASSCVFAQKDGFYGESNHITSKKLFIAYPTPQRANHLAKKGFYPGTPREVFAHFAKNFKSSSDITNMIRQHAFQGNGYIFRAIKIASLVSMMMERGDKIELRDINAWNVFNRAWYEGKKNVAKFFVNNSDSNRVTERIMNEILSDSPLDPGSKRIFEQDKIPEDLSMLHASIIFDQKQKIEMFSKWNEETAVHSLVFNDLPENVKLNGSIIREKSPTREDPAVAILPKGLMAKCLESFSRVTTLTGFEAKNFMDPIVFKQQHSVKEMIISYVRVENNGNIIHAHDDGTPDSIEIALFPNKRGQYTDIKVFRRGINDPATMKTSIKNGDL